MPKTSDTQTSTKSYESLVIALSLVGIIAYLALKYALHLDQEIYHFSASVQLSGDVEHYQKQFHYATTLAQLPLLTVLLLGGLPLVYQLLSKLLHGELGADFLAGIAIVTSIVLNEYLAGSLVVLMLSGGALLEAYAVRKASSVLEALAKRMPSVAHRQSGDKLVDIKTQEVRIGDILLVLPHEICPVDGTVIDGIGSMDESYLTGEPYHMPKTCGSQVMSGAVNGDSALTIQADKLTVDSRYAKIMEVMHTSEQHRPKLRRLGDQIGALYTPLTLLIGLAAWFTSHDVSRFLAVLVIATPCPLIIGIPIAVIGSISLAAKREIIIKNPAILETIGQCRTAIFDKTGTLTYGRPSLVNLITTHNPNTILQWVASLERYSKHPLSSSILKAAEVEKIGLLPVSQIAESPGEGLKGNVDSHFLQVTSRKHFMELIPINRGLLPPITGGLECIALVDGHYAATLQFRDEIRSDSPSFINHLQPNHAFGRVMVVSGDKESEVRHLAKQVGIKHVYFSQSPEQKLELVRQETKAAKTVYVGDGINDAPALMAASIGVAFGQNGDITSEAADAVIMDSSLQKVDELLHIGVRMRKIALQSAIGGITLSIIGMAAAATGHLTPVVGALVQEVIDIIAILNALRAAVAPKQLSDY